MKSIVSYEVFAQFPDYIRGVVIGKNINNHGENKRLLKLLRKAEQDATRNTVLQEIKSHPRIACWRQAILNSGLTRINITHPLNRYADVPGGVTSYRILILPWPCSIHKTKR